MKIYLPLAERMVAIGKEKATEMGISVSIVVLDSSTLLKAFIRMDGAVLGSIDIAIKKARTALLFERNTEQVFEFCKPGGSSFGLENTNESLVVFAGGIPLKTSDGEVAGAVGVSGGLVAQDFEVAKSAADLFHEEQERKVA